MVPQHQHKVMTSFLLWFDNHLLTKGEAFSNKTGAFYYFDDSRLPSSFKAYSSPYKQWVNDSSISGANIPSSFMGSGRADNIIFDFENGRIVETGGAFANDETLTGTFAVKDFNIYLTNETEEDLILESKFVKNSRYGDSESGIKPYDQAVPAIFINSENVTNVPLAFGGEDETKITIKAVVLAEDAYGLDGVLSIFTDTRHKEITMIPFGAHPSTEYGDLKDGSYNYTGLNSTYKGNELPMYIEDVVVSKLSDEIKKKGGKLDMKQMMELHGL